MQSSYGPRRGGVVQSPTIFGGNFIYYLDEDGERRAISPDMAIVFDVEDVEIDPSVMWSSYFVEEEAEAELARLGRSMESPDA